MNITQSLVPQDKWKIKCPYEMNAKYIVVHNTANDAPAKNEVAYMIRNNNQVSFHYAVDDVEIVQGIAENRNAWHSGDGNGVNSGNRNGIAIEICYSRSGGEKFAKAEKNATEFIAQKLKENNWDISKVKKHQDFSGKYCPHRTLDLGWDRFIEMIKSLIEDEKPTTSGTEDIIYRVQVGAYKEKANSEKMLKQLENNGFDTYLIKADELYKVQVGAFKEKANAENQAKKLETLGFTTFITTKGGQAVSLETAKKSVTEIAKEVIKGKWGNGKLRQNKLKQAGYDYEAVQKEVNRLM